MADYTTDTPRVNTAFSHFLSWEQESRDTIDFKKIYVDMAGDLLAGLLLSQIIYWHLPNKGGSRKLRIHRDGAFWLAKTRDDWYDEVRMIPNEVDRALEILETAGLIECRVWKFAGNPTKHIRIEPEGFMQAWFEAFKGSRKRPKKKFSRDGQRGKKAECAEITNVTKPNPTSSISDSQMWDNLEMLEVTNGDATCDTSSTETLSENTNDYSQRQAPQRPGFYHSVIDEEKDRLRRRGSLTEQELIALGRKVGYPVLLQEMNGRMEAKAKDGGDTGDMLRVYRAVEAAAKKGGAA